MLYYPCIIDRFGHIKQKVAGKMTREEAENYLKKYYADKWRNGEAIPQPETMQGLHV